MQTELNAKNRTELIFLISFTYMSRPAQRYYVTWYDNIVASSLVVGFLDMSQFSCFSHVYNVCNIRCVSMYANKYPFARKQNRTKHIRVQKGDAFIFVVFFIPRTFFLSIACNVFGSDVCAYSWKFSRSLSLSLCLSPSVRMLEIFTVPCEFTWRLPFPCA